MNKKEKQKFENAYLHTEYIVQDQQNHLVIRIGEINPSLDELLHGYQSRKWAFITAYNPFSKLLPDEENKIRQANFIKELEKRKFRFLNGKGQSESGDWQAEPSLFIFDIDRETAIDLGNDFEQNAIVTGQIGKAPELVWCINTENKK